MDFSVPADHRKKQNSEKRYKYTDFAGKRQKLWNMRSTVKPVVIGALSRVLTGLERELEELKIGGRAGTIRKALFRTFEILRSVLETWCDLLLRKNIS